MDYWTNYLLTREWGFLGPYAIAWGCVVLCGIAFVMLCDRLESANKNRR